MTWPNPGGLAMQPPWSRTLADIATASNDPHPGNRIMWTGYNQLTNAAIGLEVGCDTGFQAGRKHALRESGRPVAIHCLPLLGRTSGTVESEPRIPGSQTVCIKGAARRSLVGRLAPIQESLQVCRDDRGFPGAGPKPPSHPVPLRLTGRTRLGNWPAASSRVM